MTVEEEAKLVQAVVKISHHLEAIDKRTPEISDALNRIAAKLEIIANKP